MAALFQEDYAVVHHTFLTILQYTVGALRTLFNSTFRSVNHLPESSKIISSTPQPRDAMFNNEDELKSSNSDTDIVIESLKKSQVPKQKANYVGILYTLLYLQLGILRTLSNSAFRSANYLPEILGSAYLTYRCWLSAAFFFD